MAPSKTPIAKKFGALGEPATAEKLASQVCTKWSKVCPAKNLPKTHLRKDEIFYSNKIFPMRASRGENASIELHTPQSHKE